MLRTLCVVSGKLSVVPGGGDEGLAVSDIDALEAGAPLGIVLQPRHMALAKQNTACRLKLL